MNSGDTGVADENSTTTLFDASQDTLYKPLTLTFGQAAALQPSQDPFLDVSRPVEPRINFEKADGAFDRLGILSCKVFQALCQAARESQLIVEAEKGAASRSKILRTLSGGFTKAPVQLGEPGCTVGYLSSASIRATILGHILMDN
jgi:hypothetical protein